MKKRILIVVVFLIISAVAFGYFVTHRIPANIESKGTEEMTVMISLATAVVSLATAIVTLITTWRKGQKG
ncbi:hypothetical protein FJZ31_14680 [Candidatus Poribacteria bacterium]|nr:hypothetical protein [Candidatus Poribacteria bacterium]